MPAHIACRPIVYPVDAASGCFVVCAEHGLRQSFGSAHSVAHAACVEHNRLHHLPSPRTSPQLLSLVYESFATTEFSETELDELLDHARSSNSASGVTGMLLIEDGWFLQVLEGPEPIVRKLMGSIRRDPRHRRVRVLTEEIVRQRRFPDWAMALGHIGDVETLPLAQYYEALLMARGQTLSAA